jgi:alkylhydroperoxidase family enzyme
MGKGDDRLDRVIDWQVQDVFTPPERAALRLAEEATALGAEYDSVSDETWAQVEAQFDERQRAGLVLMIGTMNMFTRMNVATRQTTADWA